MVNQLDDLLENMMSWLDYKDSLSIMKIIKDISQKINNVTKKKREVGKFDLSIELKTYPLFL